MCTCLFVTLFGVLTFIPAIANFVTLNGAQGELAMANFVLSIFNVIWSGMGIVLGMWALIYDQANWWVSVVSVVWTYTSIVVFTAAVAGEIVAVSAETVFQNPYVPAIFSPTLTDMRLVGSMAILSLFVYLATGIGALVLAQIALMHFQNPNKWNLYVADYYKKRVLYYAFWIVTSGIAQLILGIYALERFGNGPYNQPLTAAFYVVTWPEATVFIGLLQLGLGIYSYYLGVNSSADGQFYKEHRVVYQSLTLFTFLAVVSIQLMMQLAPTNIPGFAQSCLYIALAIAMPWLIEKANSAPSEISKDYYSLTGAVAPSGDSEKMPGPESQEMPTTEALV